MVTLKQIHQARKVIEGRLVRTPMVKFDGVGNAPSAHFKLELFQRTGSYKVRGALNRLARLTPEEKRRGVITISSGNQALALAFATALESIPATIVMPDWSDDFKVQASRDYGGNVVLTEQPLMDVCRQLQREHSLTLIHPFDDPLVIAGSGTVGLEILEEIPDPDLVLVSVGGGGLISGVAAAIKQSCPSARIVGVEPLGAAAVTVALEQGKPVTLQKIETVADGLAAPFAGHYTLAHVREYVDEVVLVSDEEILASLRALLQQTKVLCEPAAAAAFAPLFFNKIEVGGARRIVCILCGGNISSRRLKSFL